MALNDTETDPSDMIAKMALQLCGSDFRLHGRSADHGLDCIGLAAQCLGAAGIQYDIPTGYSIRGGSVEQIEEAMTLAGFTALSPGNPVQEGDIILVRPSPIQWHLMIKTAGGFVHAHAGLGQVVFAPGAPQWPTEKIFRMTEC